MTRNETITEIRRLQAAAGVANPATVSLLGSYLPSTLEAVLRLNQRAPKKSGASMTEQACALCGTVEQMTRGTKYCSEACRRQSYRLAHAEYRERKKEKAQ